MGLRDVLYGVYAKRLAESIDRESVPRLVPSGASRDLFRSAIR